MITAQHGMTFAQRAQGGAATSACCVLHDVILFCLWYSQHFQSLITQSRITAQRYKNQTSYLNTVKDLVDFGGIFHFEEGAQVSCRVIELYLEPFVSKSDLTAYINGSVKTTILCKRMSLN